MPAARQLICLVLCFSASTVLAEQESSTLNCIGHKLTTEQVKERLFMRALAAFATWQVDAVELSPCLSDDGVAAQVVLSLPKGWSNLNVPYRMRLPFWLDPRTGMPTDDKKNIILQNVPAIIKKLLPQIENEESVCSFLERYQEIVVWIDRDNGTDTMRIDFQSNSTDGANGPQLLLQANVPGFVVGYRLSHIDGLPVRRELLRFAELLSIQQPGCMISDIKAQRQENPVEGKEQKTRWLIDARLHGKGCQSPVSLMVDENGNKAPDPDN